MRASMLLFAACVLPACVLTACDHEASNAIVLAPQPKVDPNKAPVITLEHKEVNHLKLTTAIAERKVVPQQVELPAQLEPDANLTTPVVALMPGRIEDISVMLGDKVSKGEILASIRSDEIAQIEADLLKDVLDYEADIEQQQVDYQLHKAVFDRKTQLFNEGIAAKAEVEEAKRDVDKALAEVRNVQRKKESAIKTATERMRLFGVHTNEIQRLLKTRMIDNTFDSVCPRDGVITARDADVAQIVDNGHRLFVVSDLSRVWLIAQASERHIRDVRPGLPVICSIDSFPGKVFSGKVDYMDAALDPDTRTLSIRVTIPNEGSSLKPKMFGRMKIITGQREVLAVPAGAVQKTGEVYVVYIQRATDTFEERQVVVGQQFPDYVEILKGLNPGDKIVVNGSLHLQGKVIQDLSK